MISLAADPDLALKFALESEVVQELLQLVSQREVCVCVLDALGEITSTPIDPRWSNPHEDACIALLAVVKHGMSLEDRQKAAEKVLGIQNASWSRRIALSLL